MVLRMGRTVGAVGRYGTAGAPCFSGAERRQAAVCPPVLSRHCWTHVDWLHSVCGYIRVVATRFARDRCLCWGLWRV
jgi:hypothetical protein